MNLLELFVKIGVDDQATSKIGTITQKIGSGLQAAAKIGTAAVTAASTAVVALAKNAVENYAEYEQLVGGVETLFKESADAVMQYADNAYKSAGMSANDYMSTVTSFSASLLQSLGGDTAAATEYANQAITDMSDNANKMGTDMSLIQNAYQGFAKANYTMLDNLKLGYGGTQEEMKRLIADAAALDESIDANSMSFANIVQAIHVVQTEMGITGTTAKEAASTISGSVSSMGAAWQNLLTGMADDTQDFGTLVNNFVESVETAGQNLLPRIEVVLGGVVNLVDSLAPMIIERLPDLVEQILPQVLSGAGNIVGALGNTLITGAPTILDTGITLLMNLMQGMTEGLPETLPYIINVILGLVEMLTRPETLVPLLNSALDLILALADGLIQAIPELIKSIPLIVGNLIGALFEFLPELKDVGFQLLESLISAFDADFMGEYFSNVSEGIKTGFSGIEKWFQETFGEAWKKVKEIFGVVGEWFSENVVQPIKNVFSDVANWFDENVIQPIWNFIEPVVNNIEVLVTGTWEIVKTVFSAVANWFDENVIQPVSNFFSPMWEGIKEKASDAWKGIKETFSKVGSFFEDTFSSAWKKVKKVFSTGGQVFNGIKEGIAETFKNIVNGLIDGINTVVEKPFNAINKAIESLRSKDILGFRPFEGLQTLSVPKIPKLERGGILARGQIGLLEGNGAEAVVPLDQNEKWINAVAKAMANALGYENGRGGVSIIQNIYSQAQTAADLMQEAQWEAERAVLMSV